MKIIKAKCPNCGYEHSFEVSEEQYVKYMENSDFIQNIFPKIAPEYREMLISGICPDCWNKLFGEDDV